MRPSVRFLGLALIGWTGIRAMTLDAIPDAQLFNIAPSEAKSPPPIVATEFPPMEAVQFAESDNLAPTEVQLGQTLAQSIAIPFYYASPTTATAPSATSLPAMLPDPAVQFYGPTARLDDWDVARLAAISIPQTRSVVVTTQSRAAIVSRPSLDRLQLATWALLRGQQGMALGTPSLAARGSLGGSQAGARLSYNFTRQIAASFRTNSDVGRRGAEVAAGMRVQPISSIPIWLTAERRQRVGDGSGRNAFALFAEGGIYQQPMPWNFDLDAYLQAGVAGLRSRDAFIDGGMTLTRPLYRQFAAGFGFWGAAQPGVYRVDGGPRITMKVRDNLRVHFDWRQRLAGNAAPGSGPAITLAGDF